MLILCVLQVWSFAPPPEDDLGALNAYVHRSNSAGLVAPYQDPVFGELPSYHGHGAASSSRLKGIQRLAEQQDEVMTDVYGADGRGGEGGEVPVPELEEVEGGGSGYGDEEEEGLGAELEVETDGEGREMR